MLNLILKDLMYQKTLIRSVIILAFVLVCFQSQMSTDGIYFLMGFAFVYVIVEAVEKIEGFRKANNITNSLPISRKQIVISRYIEMVILQVFIQLLCYTISYLMKIFGYSNIMSFNKLLFVFEFITIIMCFNLLMDFSLRFKVSQIVTNILYFVIWMGSFTFFLKSHEDRFSNINKVMNFLSFDYYEMQLVVAAFTIIFFIVCLLLSIKFYEKKDI